MGKVTKVFPIISTYNGIHTTDCVCTCTYKSFIISITSCQSLKDRDPTNYIRLSNFPKDKRLENPSLSLIVGRILLLCIASIKKRRQCAQNWTFDNTGNTIVFVIESKS